MLQTSEKRPAYGARTVTRRARPDAIELISLRRHWLLACSMVLAALTMAGLYLALRPPSFTAVARVVVDNRVLQMTSQNSVYTTSATSTGWASPHVLSQVEILRSQRVGQRAVALLERQGRPLTVTPPRLVDRIYDDFSDMAMLRPILLSLGAKPRQERGPLAERLVDSVRRQTTVNRIGETFAIEIKGRSEDARQAARLTNAVVAAYLEEIAAVNAEAAKGASGWLRDMAREAGSTAWIISEATPPLERDGPATGYVLAVAIIGGAIGGAALAFARDVFDRRVRRPDQFADLLGAECFGDTGRLRPGDQPSPLATEVAERVHVAALIERHDVRALGFCPLTDCSAAMVVAQLVADVARSNNIDVDVVGYQHFPVASASHSELVLVVLPTAEKAAAVRATLPVIDAIIVVAEPGSLSFDVAADRLAALGPIGSRVIGGVLAATTGDSRHA